MRKAVTLLYHDVVSAGGCAVTGFMDSGALIYKFPEAEFRRHMEALAAAGLTPATDVAAGTFFLTFDDGGVSNRDITAGILEEHGWRGHFFLTTGRVGTPGFLSVSALRDLHARGHVIGSHSVSHPPRMAALNDQQLRQEWSDSRRFLEDALGAAVESASVPGGYYSSRVAVAAAAAGYRTLFNSEPVQRVTEYAGCRILGRYSVQQGVTAETAVRLGRGDSAACARQYLLWNAKKAAKTAGGSAWLTMREWILDRRR